MRHRPVHRSVRGTTLVHHVDRSYGQPYAFVDGQVLSTPNESEFPVASHVRGLYAGPQTQINVDASRRHVHLLLDATPSQYARTGRIAILRTDRNLAHFVMVVSEVNAAFESIKIAPRGVLVLDLLESGVVRINPAYSGGYEQCAK